ncbi:MAG: hypothetical protein AB1704_20800 [Pseudomonadota bacterium]|jgi:hypothetical protein
MKKYEVFTTILASAAALFVGAAAHAANGAASPVDAQQAQLNLADQHDIRIEAEWAVQQATVKLGSPVAKRGGYLVPVTVANTKCEVFVRPYMPQSDLEPPMRWKADPAVCGK